MVFYASELLTFLEGSELGCQVLGLGRGVFSLTVEVEVRV